MPKNPIIQVKKETLLDKVRRVLNIDKFNLDLELERQAHDYFSLEVNLVNARDEYDRAKVFLELEDAELDMLVRKRPENHGMDKVTEAGVKAAILRHERHKEAWEALAKAKYKVGVCSAAVTAMDHRKKSLEKAVELFLSAYWADPRISNPNTVKPVKLRNRD